MDMREDIKRVACQGQSVRVDLSSGVGGNQNPRPFPLLLGWFNGSFGARTPNDQILMAYCITRWSALGQLQKPISLELCWETSNSAVR
jgi:hypothetical protein